MYFVYMHTTPNNKRYVGITRRNPFKRWKNGFGYCRNSYFYSAIKKYGWDNIKHEILFKDLTKEEAEKKEIELISFYNSANRENGYNHSLGGTASNSNISEETRLKMSLSHLGKKTKPMSEDLKRKHSQYMKEHWKDDEFRNKLMNNLRKKRCIKVQCVETGVKFNSIKEAGEILNISRRHITDCCLGKRKTTGGYHWIKVVE